MSLIQQALTGGDRRSLGRTEEVVLWVLADGYRLDELFECLFVEDKIVRMRASDGLEKVARQQPDRFVPYVERLLTDVAEIEQASVQWHLAQILSEIPLTTEQQARAIELLKLNLDLYDDWIVVNLTLEALAKFARQDDDLRQEFRAILRRYQYSPKKSIASRVRKLLREFG
ncbi:MAG: hypothetical protein KJ065_12025 [Anaerolineae bacterium]|nr:hypothetical protein [Anaerolineae bacterium]